VLAIVVVIVTLTLPCVRLGRAIFGDPFRTTSTRHTSVGRPSVQDSRGRVLTDFPGSDRKRERTPADAGERVPKHRPAADERSRRATAVGSVRSKDDRGLTSVVRDEPIENDPYRATITASIPSTRRPSSVTVTVAQTPGLIAPMTGRL